MISSLAPLIPALVIVAYFVLGLIVFSIRTRIFGLDEDPDVTGRPASKLLGRFLRHFMMWMLSPYEKALVRLKVSPNAITMFSLAVAAGAAVAIGSGRFALGGWLYLFTGICDILDGRVARRSGRVSAGGAFFDSVMDRYSELVVFAGFAVFYRDSWALALALLAGIGSVMVSYSRARGESLGVDVKIGAMQRPERLFYLGFITLMAPIPEALWGHGALPAFPLAVAALALLAATANVTAARRVVHTLKRLDRGDGVRVPSGQAVPITSTHPLVQPRVFPVRNLRGALRWRS